METDAVVETETRMQAAVLLTHIESEAVENHFRRLKAECRGLLDAFLCVHEPSVRSRATGIVADFRVSASDEARTLAKRYAEKLSRGGKIVPGFCDLVHMPVLSDRLSTYGHVWILEYDVDFAGPWADFFAPLVASSADFIGTTLYYRRQCPDWMWWSTFEAPAHVRPAGHLRSFGPVARFSRRMISCYRNAVETEGWQGHAEALYPTVARQSGLMIEDLGGNGPFTPPSLLGKNYCNTPGDPRLVPGCFTTRPPRQTAYFHVAPEAYPVRGYLYHPIKVHDGLDVLDPV